MGSRQLLQVVGLTAALASVILLSGTVALGVPTAMTPSHQGYVATELLTTGGVTPFSTTSDGVSQTVKTGKNPGAVAITPDGTKLYVANEGSNTLSVVASATNTVVTTVTLSSTPQSIAITPDGSTVYVSMSNGDLLPVPTQTNTPGRPISVGAAGPLALTPDGSMAYIGDDIDVASNTVVPVDLRTKTSGTPITVGRAPVSFAVTPNGKILLALSYDTNTVSAISTATNLPLATIAVCSEPTALAISPDGKTAYVACWYSNVVTPIDIATDSAGKAITVAKIWGTGIAVTPDSSTVFVTFGYDQMKVQSVSVATTSPGTTFTVGGLPMAIAIVPDQAPVASLAVTAEPARQPSTLDASASHGTTSPIKSYRWSFGDGTTATTRTSTITHTYTTPGTYHTRVIVTDQGGTSTTQVFTGQTVARNGGPSAQARVTVNIS
jgi:YVTN family beta-propeller protein